MILLADSEGPDQTALMRSLIWAFTVCICVKTHFCTLYVIAITLLGEERANLSAFHTFVRFVLVWFCRFPLPLGIWEGLRFVIVALPGLFSYLFILLLWKNKKLAFFQKRKEVIWCSRKMLFYSPSLKAKNLPWELLQLISHILYVSVPLADLWQIFYNFCLCSVTTRIYSYNSTAINLNITLNTLPSLCHT